MAKAAELLNNNTKATDILVIGASSYYKEGIVGRAGSLDHPIATTRVGTHADDAALTVGTDAVVAIAGLADETASDSVDEGDVGALRMTLDRRLITAGQGLDDAAFTPATSYVNPIGALADETGTDSVDEGDAGIVRMTLNRRLITAAHLLDDSPFGIGTDYVAALGALADETTSDVLTEGDVGIPRMTLDRQLRVAPASGTLTDRSLAITTGGTAQQLMAANQSRKYLLVQNISAETVWINFTTTAVQDSPSIKLTTGSTYEQYGGFVSTELISVIAATTGSKIVAKEG